VVESIDYSNETASVQTTDGREFTAGRVVVAIPLAIMDQVEFTPPLDDDKQTAIDNVYVSPGIKAWLEFSHRFYPDIVCGTIAQHIKLFPNTLSAIGPIGMLYDRLKIYYGLCSVCILSNGYAWRINSVIVVNRNRGP
jgi:Flavin containing amine oxidoreductase